MKKKNNLIMLGQGTDPEVLAYEWEEAFTVDAQRPGETMSQRALRIIRDYPEATNIVGHSAGAPVAMLAALLKAKIGKQYKRIALVCPAPLKGMRVPLYIQWQIMKHPIKYLWPTLAGKSFHLEERELDGLIMKGSEDLTIRQIMKRTLWSGLVLREMLFSGMPWIFQSWKSIKSEIRVIGASSDSLIKKTVVRAVAKKVMAPTDPIEWVGGGHMVMSGKNGKRNLDKILRFLEKGNLCFM